ncbi:MAG: hypothetical protein SH819_00740 [Cytophagales bacterium]|nr:hypothetical protein [Cytophagales bacterium]
MELLETQDPEKKKLIASSERHRHALQKELSELSKKRDRILINTLVIGGTLAVTYLVVSSVFKKNKKNREKESGVTDDGSQEIEEQEEEAPSAFSQLGLRVLNKASEMLLGLAREKLSEYLESRKKKDEDS